VPSAIQISNSSAPSSVETLVYRRGASPAPFEFRGTSGWTITVDMNSGDVVASR
jgi:hypothetical protein